MSGRRATRTGQAFGLIAMFALICCSPLHGDERFTFLEGQTSKGTLASISADGQVATQPPANVAWRFDDLLSIDFGEPSRRAVDAKSAEGERAAPRIQLDLQDSSRLFVETLTLNDERFECRGVWSSQSVSLPIEQVAKVVWRKGSSQTPADSPRWRPDAAADRLLVRDGSRVETLTGVVTAITKDALEIEVEGKRRSLDLSVVEAIVFAAPESATPISRAKPSSAATPSAVIANLRDGSRIVGHSLTWRDNQARLVGPGGGEFLVAREELRDLQCESPRRVWLSDLKPKKVEQSTLVAIPRVWQIDRSIFGGPLAVGDRRWEKGLGLQATTVLEYSLPERTEWLVVEAGLDRAAAGKGDCELRFWGDSETPVAQVRLVGGKPSQVVRVPLAGDRRLKVTVEPGEHLDLADQVVLGGARLVVKLGERPASPAPGR